MTKVKPNKLDTLIDLIADIEDLAYMGGISVGDGTVYNRYDRMLARAKTKAYKIIDSLRK